MQARARAAVLAAFNQPLAVEELPLPTVGPGQVLVRVLAAGVCGSDVHMWQGLDPRTPLPMILGHEGVGEVLELGAAVGTPRRTVDGLELRPGDRVIWNRGVSCGHCYYCAVLRAPSLCRHRWAYGIHRSCAQPPHLTGCYAQALLLDARTDVLKLDPRIDPAVLVAASCSGATTAHAFELCPPDVGDTVLVQGAGPLGAFAVAFARAQGARQVVVIAGTASRLELCRALGATAVLDRNATTAAQRREAILDLTGRRGADLVVEATGSPAAVEEGLPLVRPGGAYALVGFGEPRPSIPLDCFALARRNVRLQGVWVSDTAHLKRAVDLVLAQPALFASLVTHRFPLAEATAALKAVANRQAMKAVIVP